MGAGFSAVASDARQQKSGEGAIGLANPAAVFCVEQGGRFEIREAKAGGTGIRILPDGTEVDAWTYFREQSRPPLNPVLVLDPDAWTYFREQSRPDVNEYQRSLKYALVPN